MTIIDEDNTCTTSDNIETSNEIVIWHEIQTLKK